MMKITKIDTFLVNVGHRNLPLVKVYTDEDIYGIGEAYSCGPVATAVNVHFAAGTQNFLILEYIPDDEAPRRELVDEPMKLVDGYLERPGLGLDFNEAVFERYPFKSWRRPFHFKKDGALAFQ